MPDLQTTNAVLMIRPARFRSNPQTASSNAFQHDDSPLNGANVQLEAAREFDGLVAALVNAGVEVIVAPDTPERDKPDAIFPNNWLSTHADGTVVRYPMHAVNRRLERRPDIITALADHHDFDVRGQVDLADAESREQFLEGTGSLVLDRANHVAYACLSPRTHPALLKEWCARFDYESVAFEAASNGRAIYHTNVMMAVGERLAVVCLAAIVSPGERDAVRARLVETGHDIVDISPEQMNAFAGNMLELKSADGESLFVMSRRAHDSLDKTQLAQIETRSKIVSVPIATIEDNAGGSVRCMLAEIFLPKRNVGAA